MRKPPNILFLMSDEHRADVTGYEGDAVIHTPTLDWLAETVLSFATPIHRHQYVSREGNV